MLYADAGDNVQTFTQGGNTYRVSQTLSNLLGKQLRIDVATVQQGVATRDDTDGRAPDPGRQPVRGDGHGHQSAHLRARACATRSPSRCSPARGPSSSTTWARITWEEIDRSVAGAQLRLERRQHRWVRPDSARSGHLPRSAPGL